MTMTLHKKCVARKPSALQKVTLLRGFFSRFLNCTNDTKSSKASYEQLLHKAGRGSMSINRLRNLCVEMYKNFE